ncbi:hypothetical protein [Saccharopolyspora griseoalba]|uniref:Uncharacterized protein n=1 Tax=Saccharopolyspora griseoalba TaxID=1431848 RepID=A0ABW2LRV4_9PSEU
MKPQRAVASFDSATGMLRALSCFLAGRDVPALGQALRSAVPLLSAAMGGVNHLPTRAAEHLYAASGVAEAVPRTALGRISAEDLAEWVVDHYPRRRYPVVFVGSSNGALMHLAAALDAPWLPQTLLVPVRRRGVDRDDPRAELDAGRQPAHDLLRANPGLSLHHMHDPNQDRLMIAGMSYFRVKWRSLPAAYRRFLRDHVERGGTVISVECGLSWPVTRLGPRHRFQFGALGGASEAEYHEGGPRVSDLLRRYGAARTGWDPPQPDERAPEAEWGFDPALLDDLRDATGANGLAFRRLRFGEPEELSPPVAELHRWWYRQRGVPDDRLLAESFLLMEPWWALRTGSIPFWMAFNTESSHQALSSYLDALGDHDEIRLMLFSHGTESIGLATAEQWLELVGRARKVGTLAGCDTAAYPRDFASLVRAQRDLSRVRHRHPMPAPLRLDSVAPVLAEHPDVDLTDPV